MNYATCKNLKDAGFPQHGHGMRFINDEEHVIHYAGSPERLQEGHFFDFAETNNYFYLPLLDELILACGDDFKSLKKKHHGKNGTTWTAQGRGPKRPDGNSARDKKGGSPLSAELAVAELYLLLYGFAEEGQR